MVPSRKSWEMAAFLVSAGLWACSGTSQLVGSDGSTGGASGGETSATPTAGASGSETSAAPTAGASPGTPAGAAVGDPCVSSDEQVPTFAGYDKNEVNIDNNAPQCASNFCIQNHFQGRASCPYGQTAGDSGCLVSGGSAAVSVAVQPQLLARQTATASICSCQCSGYGPGPYCACPESMECDHLIDKLVTTSLPAGEFDFSGSYCIPVGSLYDRTDTRLCTSDSCGDAHPY